MEKRETRLSPAAEKRIEEIVLGVAEQASLAIRVIVAEAGRRVSSRINEPELPNDLLMPPLGLMEAEPDQEP